MRLAAVLPGAAVAEFGNCPRSRGILAEQSIVNFCEKALEVVNCVFVHSGLEHFHHDETLIDLLSRSVFMNFIDSFSSIHSASYPDAIE
jgi:hypothetical protein